jgi:tetratricopeptide (TPR) repeat protein
VQGSSETETAHDAIPAVADGDVERRRDIPVREAEKAAVPAPADGGSEIGATLLAEATSLVDLRRFADAARVLESLQRLRSGDPEVLALVAVANAHHRRNRTTVRAALAQLSEQFGAQAITWRTVSDVSMARFHFESAQRAARTSVQLGPKNERNWYSLAAAYAGHGWFDEASECMSEATRLESVHDRRSDSGDSLSFGQWQVGRAVNHWAITKTYVAVVAILGFLYMGLLGLAVALSAPMLLREIRVRRVPEPFRSLADHAWRTEHRLRIANAVVVMVVLIAWVVLFSITR